MDIRETMIVLDAKRKELGNLCDFALNQMSQIERGLNPASSSRDGLDRVSIRWAPHERDIDKLSDTLKKARQAYVVILGIEQEALADGT